MTADDELQQAFATLTDHLHEEIGRQIEQATAELTAAAREERERAVADATAEAARQADVRVAAELEKAATLRADAETRAREEGRQIGMEEGRFDGYEQGKADALSQVREQQAEELERRAAESQRDAGAARSRATAAAERLADGIRTLDRARSLSEILDTLASCAAREADRVGILLAADGRFRGWRFIGFERSFDAASDIDISAEESGVIDEALRSASPVTTEGHVKPPSFAALPSDCDGIAVPLFLSGQPVGAVYAEVQRQKAEGKSTEEALEILARHAARCLEAVTALSAARLLTDARDLALDGGAARNGGDGPADEDAAALRYARLLVSEIRMYHEPEIAAGRRERDLASRLGGEIARARVLYEERVPARVRERGDHFHDELVRTLANGDGELLKS
jgi:hypothetical protein